MVNSNLNGRVTRLERTAPAPQTRPEPPTWGQLLAQSIQLALSRYGEARPGCMGVKDSQCYEWEVSWPYAWQFYTSLERRGIIEPFPRRFETKEAAQEAIEWLHGAMLETWDLLVRKGYCNGQS